jgi:Spy/CpxP family protein refolding chaperone
MNAVQARRTSQPPSRSRCSPVGVLLALMVVLLGWAAPPARAQMGMGMDAADFSVPVNRRSLEDYVRILSLNGEQKDALKSLYEGYMAAHAEAMKEMRKTMQEAQEKAADTGDFRVFQKELPKKMRAVGERVEQNEKNFYEDSKALLTGEQQESWPKVERHRRREKGLRFGFISGQSVDLVRVVNALKLDPASVPGLADQIDRYEADMDRAIVAFERFGKDQEKRQEEFADFDMSKMGEMMAKAKEMMKQALEIGKGMRDVNRQYARTIKPLLPEEQRPKFDAEFNRRAYPRIYRESYVSRALGSASGFADLTAEQRSQISEMKAEYQRELASANRAWALATEAREEKTGGQFMEMMDMMGGGGANQDVKDVANKAHDDRKELDRRFKEKLLALLTEEQKGRLPEEKKEAGGMFGMGDFFANPDDEETPSKE